jgi:hypothetical protein
VCTASLLSRLLLQLASVQGPDLVGYCSLALVLQLVPAQQIQQQQQQLQLLKDVQVLLLLLLLLEAAQQLWLPAAQHHLLADAGS